MSRPTLADAGPEVSRDALPGSPPQPVTPLDILLVLAGAILVHLFVPDRYLLGNGQTRVYITVHEVLITAIFALMMAWRSLRVALAQDSIVTRIAMAVIFAVTVGCVYWALKIVLYPYEADTIEGNIVLQGVNLRESLGLLYPDPVHHRAISYRYTPLGGVLYGTIYALAGRTLFYARLLNFGVICLTGVLLSHLVMRMDALRAWLVFAGWLCLQIYFCGYLYSLRPDATLTVLLTIACLLFRRYLSTARVGTLVACGIVLALAFLTKQHALLALAGFILTLAWKRDFRAGIILSAVMLTPLLLFTLWMNSLTNGWYLRTTTLGTHQAMDLPTFYLLMSSAIPVFILASGIRAAWFAGKARPLFSHSDLWLYCVAALYFFIAVVALMQGGPGSMNNMAFEFAILLPAASAVVARSKWGVLACGVLLALSLPYYVIRQPFAPWMIYAPAQAAEAVAQIRAAKGPVLLGRRQEFLFRTGKPVYDDLGVMNYEFALVGYSGVTDRVNRTIRSGKYELIMLETGESSWLEPATREYLLRNYSMSDDPGRALFQERLTKRRD